MTEDIQNLLTEIYDQEPWDAYLKQCFVDQNYAKAIAALEKADKFYGSKLEINWSLALCHLKLGDFDKYESYLKQCQIDDPSNESSLLLLAELNSKRNKHQRAKRLFADAYQIQPSYMSEAYFESASPVIKNALNLARGYLFNDYLTGADKILGELHRKGDIARLQKCFETYLGKHPKQVSEMFNPSTLYFPDIRRQPFYSANEFPNLEVLTEYAESIMEDYKNIDAPFEDYINLHSNKGGEFLLPQFKDFDKQNWHAFHLHRYGKIEKNCVICKKTSEALDKVELPEVNGFMPEAFFSRLGAKSKIPGHYGLSNVRLAVHWPIIINDNCFIDVGGERKSWKLGEPMIFDDSFFHFAENNSEQDRIVLIFDVWHPDLTKVEKIGIKKFFEIKTIINP